MEPSSEESIFYSSMRTFFKSLLGVLGICAAFIPIFLVIALLSSNYIIQDKNSLILLPDHNGNKELLTKDSSVILRIDLNGIIGEDELTIDDIRSKLEESQTLIASHRVKGILLYVNTPGGGVSDSDGIYKLLQEYKRSYNVPIFAYVEGLCASGGMYICSAATKIYSSPVSLIGSVGVIMGPFFNVTQALEKLGIESKTLTEGKDKDMMSPFRKWTEDESASLKAIETAMYQRFVNIVTSARIKLDKEKLVNEYGAHIFLADKAEELGYIDNGNVDYTQTLRELAKAANLESYQLIKLETKGKFIKELLKGESPLITGKIKHAIDFKTFGNSSSNNKKDVFFYLYPL